MRYQLGRYDSEIIGKAELVVFSGNKETAVFCRDAIDNIRRYNSSQGELWVCDSLAEFEKRARTPAFFGRWWYLGSADNLSQEDKKALDRLIKKPVEYGTAVLLGVEFKKYRSILRGLKNSTTCHEIASSYPSKTYLFNYLKRAFELRYVDITQTAMEDFIWRLGESYSRYEEYIELVVSELSKDVDEVKKENIADIMKGVQGASFDEFLKYLLRPLASAKMIRTTKLYKTYQCLLEDKGARALLNLLHKKSIQYLEIRRLINEGYIPVGVPYTVEQLKKLLRVQEDVEESKEEQDSKKQKQKQADTKFNYRSLLKYSDWKLEKEIEVAAQVPLADWFNIARMSGKRCSTDIEAEVVLFDIMTRTRRMDDTLL